MQYKNYKYIGVNLELKDRTRSSMTPRDLTKGRCIAITFFPFGEIPPQNINLSIEDTQGNPVLEAVDIRDYKKGTLGGIASYKPVNFRTNGQVNIMLFSPDEIVGNFYGQLVFIIDTDDDA